MVKHINGNFQHIKKKLEHLFLKLLFSSMNQWETVPVYSNMWHLHFGEKNRQKNPLKLDRVKCPNGEYWTTGQSTFFLAEY